MKKLFSLILLSLAIAAHAEDVLTIVDATDSTPLAGTTVVSSNGQIIGTADDNGRITVSSADLYPLSLRSVGYGVSSIKAPADTIRLKPIPINLPEVSTLTEDKPIHRVILYLREYMTAEKDKETIQVYSQYMGESFVTDGEKVKGYKKNDARITLSKRFRIARVTDSNGLDSIFRPGQEDEIISFVDNFNFIPTKIVEETAAIATGATTDTVQGKYSTKLTYRKTDNYFLIFSDGLADHKDHHWSPTFFKLFGFTVDFKDLRCTEAYVANNSGKYRIFDYAYGTLAIEALASGKFFKQMMHTKKPIKVNCFIEIYPVEITNLSVDEYKPWRKNRYRRDIEVRKPEYTLPLPPAIKEMVERAKTELK